MKENAIAYMYDLDGRFELVYPEYGIRVRAPYAEWAFEAAADIITRMEKTKCEGDIDELEMMKEIGEGGDELSVQIDAAKFESNNRFEIVPQCVISLGNTDYRWVSRNHKIDENSNEFGKRIHDMSLTRNNSFLVNEDN